MSRIQRHMWMVALVVLAMANADESARAAGEDDKTAPTDASQAAPSEQRPLAQDASQPDTDFPVWFLKSTRLIDPRLRPSAGIRVPGVSPREGGPLLFPNFPEN